MALKATSLTWPPGELEADSVTLTSSLRQPAGFAAGVIVTLVRGALARGGPMCTSAVPAAPWMPSTPIARFSLPSR